MSCKGNVLVTGGAGMIGSNLVERLVREGWRVTVADNLWRGKREYLLDDDGQPVIDLAAQFFEVDLAVPDALEPHLAGVDYVFHLADVVAGVGFVFDHQGFTFRQNLLINSNVIHSAKKFPLKGFLYVGTACSFPAHLQTGVEAAPLREADQYPAAPESAYGWSKLMGEYETLLLGRETGIPVAVLVFHNVYGPPCDFTAKTGQVIPSLIRKAIAHPAEPFVVWGSGSQGRAFVHVDDIIEALMLAMQRGLGQGVIQIGPDRCISIREIAETIVEISGKPIAIEFDTTKPEGDRGRCADFVKARQVLGWEPRVPLSAGLKQLYAWIEQRMARSA
jgi:GDP-D-mannose 3',5'-epimerase